MSEEIKNDIDKLDGMVKIKGKCGYEIIGGCSDLRRLKQENKKLKEKLEKIKELATPLRCNNPLDCWMNKDEGTGDIYGCEGDDYKGCPSGFASCILKIIEGAEE